MAELFVNGIKKEVEDGHLIALVCEEQGLPFDCNAGVCGSCRVRVVEGAQNLNPLTQEESDLGLDEHSRLACVTKILQGKVVVEF